MYRREAILVVMLLLLPLVLAQDFTFRLKGEQASLGSMAPADILYWGAIMMIIYGIAYAGLCKATVFKDQKKAAGIISLGIALASVVYLAGQQGTGFGVSFGGISSISESYMSLLIVAFALGMGYLIYKMTAKED